MCRGKYDYTHMHIYYLTLYTRPSLSTFSSRRQYAGLYLAIPLLSVYLRLGLGSVLFLFPIDVYLFQTNNYYIKEFIKI